MKKLGIALLLSLLFSLNVNAFVIENTLEDQVDIYEDTTFEDDYIQLFRSGAEAQELFINPNFPTWRDMFLSTSNGVYVNRQFDADFSIYEPLTELFPDGLTEIKFESNYTVNGMMLAYSPEKVYISYNRGDSWNEISLGIEEELHFIHFGPNYGQNNQLYFITDSGLYRRSMSSGTNTLLVESVYPGSVKNFRYIRTQNSDAIFYVVNYDTLLKTEDYAENWLEVDFDVPIIDLEIKQKTLTDGHLMVLTEDMKIHYATKQLTFFDLDLPGDISQIYSADYIILTDLGFYITINNGDSWSHLEYDSEKISSVTDYDFALDGTLKSLYIISDGVLYRDSDLNEELEKYMGGLEQPDEYKSQGTATSVNLLDLHEEQFAEQYVVTNAMLIADGDLNDQTMDFYMTADGEHWEEVSQGVNHTFEYPGRNLQWKVEMSTEDNSVTPVLRTVEVDFGMEEMEGCAGFSDIAFDDPYCPAIEYVKDQEIFSGYPDGTFGADLEINRAETVKVITEGFSVEMLEDDGTDLGFSDVETGAWYMEYLNTAKTAEIIEGYSDGTFRPAETVNYVEMMKIFIETADVQLTEPAAGDAWYQHYIDYATTNDLLVYEDVNADMKRADVAQLFYDWSMM